METSQWKVAIQVSSVVLLWIGMGAPAFSPVPGQGDLGAGLSDMWGNRNMCNLKIGSKSKPFDIRVDTIGGTGQDYVFLGNRDDETDRMVSVGLCDAEHFFRMSKTKFDSRQHARIRFVVGEEKDCRVKTFPLRLHKNLSIKGNTMMFQGEVVCQEEDFVKMTGFRLTLGKPVWVSVEVVES